MTITQSQVLERITELMREHFDGAVFIFETDAQKDNDPTLCHLSYRCADRLPKDWGWWSMPSTRCSTMKTTKPHILVAMFGATIITLCLTLLYAVHVHEQHAGHPDGRVDCRVAADGGFGWRSGRSENMKPQLPDIMGGHYRPQQ